MTDRATLQAAVDAWLIRDDIAADSTNFGLILKLAEAKISRVVRAAVMEKTATLTFTGRSEDLPADFLEARNPFVDDTVRRMDYLTPEALRRSSVWSTGRVGQFYTLEGGGGTAPDDRMQMTIAAPASVSTPLSVDVYYYARFPALTAPTDTNWLITNHFDIYLYATLRAAAEFIQEDALEDRYAGKFDRAVAELRVQENRRRFGAMPKHKSNFPRTIV